MPISCARQPGVITIFSNFSGIIKTMLIQTLFGAAREGGVNSKQGV